MLRKRAKRLLRCWGSCIAIPAGTVFVPIAVLWCTNGGADVYLK